MGEAKELFISYGREPETVNFVRLLKRDLEARGLSVWLDSEDIAAGCDWYSAIGQGLENCRGIVAVVTNKYINSHYCKSELYTANNDRKLIFPVMFEDVDFSASSAAKGVKYIISGINWTMFRPNIDDYNISLGRLCQGMKEQGLGKGDAATDNLTNAMGQLNVSSGVDVPSAPPLHSYETPPHAPPTTLPPPPPHAPYPGRAHSPTPYPTSPQYPGQAPPPGHAYNSPYQYPPYQTTPPGQPYGYGHSPGYPPHHYGYTPPPPSQHQGMYVPPVATPPAPPPQQPTDFTDHGPPAYSDLYHQPPVAPRATTPQPEPHPPTEKPPISSISAPSQPSSVFKVGMKLEAVDRRFPYFVCVATIMDRSDSEVLIHFDGWGDGYDYWCPPDAVELHPPGWCDRHNWELQTPREQSWNGWQRYLEESEADAAPEHMFTTGQLSGPGSLLFRSGMNIEAKDRHNPSLVCVATIKKVDQNGKLLVHFDGWSQNFDYWCDPSTCDIHPPMWCGKNERRVEPPSGFTGQFKWSVYLTSPGMVPAPAHLFTKEQLSAHGGRSPRPRPPSGQSLGSFKVDMKLEAKDRLNPSLIAVATVANIRDGRLLIHFDGWTSRYDYWCKPTSTDIHPMGWCLNHGRTLQPPKGMDNSSFSWKYYLVQCGAKAVPTNAFTSKPL